MSNHRRNRLQQLLRDRFEGSQTRLAQAAGVTKGRISQLLDDDSAFGERAAQRLAKRLRLPSDYFDVDMPISIALLSDQALEIAMAYERASDAEKKKVLAVMEAAGVFVVDVSRAPPGHEPRDGRHEVVVVNTAQAPKDAPPAHGELLGGHSQWGDNLGEAPAAGDTTTLARPTPQRRGR